MKCITTWTEKVKFESQLGNFKVAMDASKPIGDGSAPTPKELLLSAIAGCTAMDVIALLKKYKEIPESFSVEVNVEKTEGAHPIIFKKAELLFTIKGEVSKERAIEAVELSQTKYCGVSAMISKTVPISYKIELNDQPVFEGKSHFDLN